MGNLWSDLMTVHCGMPLIELLNKNATRRMENLAKHLFSTIGVKRPALSWGSGGDASPHKSKALAKA